MLSLCDSVEARPIEAPDLFIPRGGDTMKAQKTFDCVEMKAEIQERLMREVAELGEVEARRRRDERLARDPILGGFLRAKKAIPHANEQRLRTMRSFIDWKPQFATSNWPDCRSEFGHTRSVLSS
jgi:hypothetical protein